MKKYYSKRKRILFECERITITDKYKPDPEIVDHIIRYSEKFNQDLNIACGYTDVDMEGRFSYIRCEETNLSNFMADVIRTEYDTDFCLFNCGTLRSNCVIEQGYIT